MLSPGFPLLFCSSFTVSLRALSPHASFLSPLIHFPVLTHIQILYSVQYSGNLFQYSLQLLAVIAIWLFLRDTSFLELSPVEIIFLYPNYPKSCYLTTPSNPHFLVTSLFLVILPYSLKTEGSESKTSTIFIKFIKLRLFKYVPLQLLVYSGLYPFFPQKVSSPSCSQLLLIFMSLTLSHGMSVILTSHLTYSFTFYSLHDFML